MKNVYIIKRRLVHYRLSLYEELRKVLLKQNIKLNLIYGEGNSEEKLKKDSGYLNWGIYARNFYFLKGRICIQSILHLIKNPDLIIIDQENKLIINLILLLLPKKYKIAFYGHGSNMQNHNKYSASEIFKKWLCNKVDWWFAYTEISAQIIEKNSFRKDKITILNNTINTTSLKNDILSITQKEKDFIRNKFNLKKKYTGIFVGSLYKEKRLHFLIKTALKINKKIPHFKLIIVGDGPEENIIKNYAIKNKCIIWVGSKTGREKAMYLSVSDIMLNPGLVGLNIIDAFVSEIPLVTTNCKLHSPEIAYLRNNINGVMTKNNLLDYSNRCINLLLNKNILKSLKIGCHESKKLYSHKIMVDNFASGIVSAIR